MKKDKPVISIVGKSGAGKTTLLEKVIKRLKEDGIRVAAIKHDAHRFDMDKPGKDTWRMAQAGADVVVISSSEKMAMIEKVSKEKSLDEIVAMLPGVDIVLTEGYKSGDKPKIEVYRSEVHKERLCSPDELLAIVSDVVWDDLDVPQYQLDDIDGVVNEIRRYIAAYDSN
ncbi:molybdopterin-guanine dinucleotide biosynthesis protein B [Thermacetogenium phaeum DSM 12270]|uniref:Molybdopterin-guanine dinucleotide biosynthesis protein B n=1 Tax=Thermacetogenium phaeum (strain ATCC BAA-254 / DSM 26808 / PB) TaxID=1089553 RepID=K4LE92_THEPS|nr:molybdopterin-guanine dinucleotide biosynthesis protein B [Thermacetogenium phaeum]AFV10397.1 molybdopterin-guanine dinucleotide biosynthesis protein B [Thermacetogenium phaeum DSM 12270]